MTTTRPRHRKSRLPRRLQQVAAFAVATTFIAGGVVGVGQSASAAEAEPTWDSPWLAGAPIYPGEDAVELADGTRVENDFNSWENFEQRSRLGELRDIQTTSDPDRLFAIVHAGSSPEDGAIVTSADGGGEWVLIGPPTVRGDWDYTSPTGGWDISTSTNGEVVAFTALSSVSEVFRSEGGLFLSTDDGKTFTTPTGLPKSYEWSAVGVSGDGQTVVAVGFAPDGSESGVWVSADQGATWDQTAVSAGDPGVSETKRGNVLVSSDGRTVSILTSAVALDSQDARSGTIEVSTNQGQTWESHATPAGGAFADAAMDGDGTKIVITRGVTYRYLESHGVVSEHAPDEGTFTSDDLGRTWTETLDDDGASLGHPGVAVPLEGIVQDGDRQPDGGVDRWYVEGYEPAVSPDGALIWQAPIAGTSIEIRGNRLSRLKLTRFQSTTQLAPEIDSLSPNTGTTEGGTGVTVTGSWFNSCSVVKLAGIEQATVLVDNSRLTFVTPAGDQGVVAVSVTDTCERVESNEVEYTYVERFIEITPDSGPTSGGDVVTVTGPDLGTCPVVHVDGVTQPTVRYSGAMPNDAPYLQYITPAHAPGEVSVAVHQSCGEGSDSPPVTYTYVAPEGGEPTPNPTEEPNPTPTTEPTPTPTTEPTPAPTEEPTPGPTTEPTPTPAKEPTPTPTTEPTLAPTEEPTPGPTKEPTPTPTTEPTPAPAEEPTPGPVAEPKPTPTELPPVVDEEQPVVATPPSVAPPAAIGDPLVVEDVPIVVTPPAVDQPEAIGAPTDDLGDGAASRGKAVKAFEAQTGVESAPETGGALSVLSVVAGLILLTVAFARRRRPTAD